MTQHYLIGLMMLAAGSILEVTCRPSTNEETTPGLITTTIPPSEKERSLVYDETNTENVDLAKEILEKIKAINDGLKKPNRRQQIKWNYGLQPETGGGYIIDKEIMEKLQQVIASGKLHDDAKIVSQQQIDEVLEDLNDIRNARQMSPLMTGNQAMSMTPMPYMMNLPVLIFPTPSMIGGYPNINPMGFGKYQTREGPTSPFEFQWPFASLFPILIRDPLLTIMNGGGWNHFLEYGQNADVCTQKHKVKSNEINIEDVNEQNIVQNKMNYIMYPHELKSRQKRAVKKRTVAHRSEMQNIESSKKTQKFFSTKSTTTTTPKPAQDTKTVYNPEGDLRFPFGDFTLFGNRKPVAPSPGFFINRLKVRRGGVAIAGPGGVATAGRGGTAIVGPGGLAYTQPGGIAVAGPAARVVALSPNADLTAIVSRLQEQSAIDGSVPQLLQAIPEGKIVATGPIIYYHPNE